MSGEATRRHLAAAAAILALCAALLLLPSGASAGQIAYMSDFDDGQLTYPEVLPDGSQDGRGDLGLGTEGNSALVLTPNGKRLFVADNEGGVWPLRVPANGYPEIASGGVASTSGAWTTSVVSARNGKTIYSTDTFAGVLDAFSVGSDGSLASKGTPINVSESPTGLAITPDGKRLYAAALDFAVRGWSIKRDGSLAELPGSPYPGIGYGYAIAVTPDGKYLYVPGRNTGGTISGYSIAKNGDLTELPTSQYTARDSDNTFSITITPDGKNLYTADYEGDANAFAIRPNGKLVPLRGGEDKIEITGNPAALATSADGKRVYVRNGDREEVDGFARRADGSLRPLTGSPFPAQGNGDFQSIALSPAQPPQAKLKVKKRARAGKKVSFNASKSRDDGKIVRYRWKFGDGKAKTTTRPRVEHRYMKPGRYRVKVTLTDDDGCSVKFVTAGQTPYCNGSKRARAGAKIKVKRKQRKR